jgi:hypothetical protein
MGTTTKIDTERLDSAVKRWDAKDKQEALQDDEDFNLLMNTVPFEPAHWNILVVPVRPRTMSDGKGGASVYVADIATEAEGWQGTVGRVMKCGPLAFDGKTASGLELKQFLPGIDCAAKLIGKYVFYQLHTGQEMQLRITGTKFKVFKLTDFLGVTADPYAWKFYI